MKRSLILLFGFLLCFDWAPKACADLAGPIIVISDVDDTVKDTHLWLLGGRHFCINPAAALSIFWPRPVKGMPELYRHWHDEWGCQFSYVSAQPKAGRDRLLRFLGTAKLPVASPAPLHVFLRQTPVSLIHLLATPHYKAERIRPLIAQWLRENPRRRFVLVGDSGEYDPESYGELARDTRNHIAAIFIREATRSEPPGSTRYARAFCGVAPSAWRIFYDPVEIWQLPAFLARANVPLRGAAGRGRSVR